MNPHMYTTYVIHEEMGYIDKHIGLILGQIKVHSHKIEANLTRSKQFIFYFVEHIMALVLSIFIGTIIHFFV